MSDETKKREIFICRSTGCNSSNAGHIQDLLAKRIAENNLNVAIKKTGCHGFCQMGPIMVIQPDNVLYVQVQPKDVDLIVKNHLKDNNVVEKLLYTDPESGAKIKDMNKVNFYMHQKPIVKEHFGKIDPESIDDYLEVGGYESLKKVLSEYSPDDVIEELKISKLRGRGGAGFPTYLKWTFARRSKGQPKYLICNGDEGDPGAFMDRSTLESDPHSVIEGMVIAGYTMGSNQGFIYTRAEYPLAIDRINKAVDSAREKGFLGENILDSGFNFDIELKTGAGAFVCGEETALMASIEGKRGMPRPRPPFPANSGLWGKPTNINNVKTYASIPKIIAKGGKWFADIGTEESGGTIIVALTGNINNSGLVEIPLGTPIRKLIYDIGGGIPEGKKFKAIQVGGPSGGCLPAKFLDTPMDNSNLTKLGAIMGSGGFIVLDDETCMVELAHFFIQFTQTESCGKCAPCRVGTKKMLDLLTKIKSGQAEMEDLDKLENIANFVKKTSLCGLGQTAPNPVLTTLKYFRDEYIAHIKYHACPALQCKDLIQYNIDPEKCIGCTLCAKNCAVDAITGVKKEPHKIDESICIRCGLCYSSCPSNAIYKTTNEYPTEEGGSE
ncbi:MAG: 4Fe-4S dicluster domain-containing protein [Candidatus Lokiarchaeota archaeon]|nr:4Fe-4S dicluster domain-containing protein [Candidatus Lokiarchaeota archaeon]